MNIITIVGLGLISTAICVLFSQYKPEYTMLISLIAGVIIFGLVLVNLTEAFDLIKNLLNKIQVSNEYTIIIVKTLGICYITQLASDSCSEAGQTSIANKIELAGKAAIILISIPLFNDLVEIATKLITI